MASNYFNYNNGTQYGQANVNSGFPQTQGSYGGGQNAASGAGTGSNNAASFNSPRNTFEPAYQTTGTPVTYTAPPAIGSSFDSTKTYYQQASAPSGTNATSTDYSTWQQTNYQGRQTNAASVGIGKTNAFSNSANRAGAGQNASNSFATSRNSPYSFPNAQNGNKAAAVGTIGQPSKKGNHGMANQGYSTNSMTGYSHSGYQSYNSNAGGFGRPKNRNSGAGTGFSTPYDQAMMTAAASMYGNQNFRGPAKGGYNRPRPGFGADQKFARNFRQPKPEQLHYCDACKISCAGPSAYHDHLQGQKHKKKVAKANPEQPKTTVVGGKLQVYVCQLCDIECTAADAYLAHLRGAKHTKVVKLHTKLGKPIPTQDPCAEAAMAVQEEAAAKAKAATIPINGATIPDASPASATQAAAPRIHFAAASNVSPYTLGNSVTATAVAPSALSQLPHELPNVVSGNEVADSNAFVVDDRPAVGSEYIVEEKDATGKLISFNCKLCDCKFSDPNAKEMHMKGRKHRLQFKKKVDPKLRVEMKPNLLQKKRNDKRKQLIDKPRDMRSMRFEDEVKDYFDWFPKPPGPMRYQLLRSPRSMMMAPGGRIPIPLQGIPQMFAYGAPPASRRIETYDDRHIFARHRAIYPTEEDVNSVQKHLHNIEKALKLVSDQMLEEAEELNEKTKFSEDAIDISDNINASSEEKDYSKSALRELTGVLRVGVVAKGLLLAGDHDIDLVMLCANKPTLSLLTKVVSMLPDQLKEVAGDFEYIVTPDSSESAFRVQSKANEEGIIFTVNVSLTSTVIREEILAEGAAAAGDGSKGTKEIIPDPPDVLSKTKCLEALAALRHAKWFQARATPSQSCLIVIRILKDLKKREAAWGQFDSWAMELLCEKVINSTPVALSPGEGLRRVFECISSGILLQDGPGLIDPCEKDEVDVFSCLTSQQREDITAFAQNALRLVAFRQIHKVLGMELLPPVSKFGKRHPPNRKRRRENSAGGQIEGKKDKKEGEEEGEEADANDEGGKPKEKIGTEAENMETDVKSAVK